MVLFSNYVLRSMSRFRLDLIDQNKAITAAATYQPILEALHCKCRLLSGFGNSFDVIIF